jgi:hypothetical protein
MNVMNSGHLLKKEKILKRKIQIEPENGDARLYTAVKRRAYLFAAFAVGKWIQQTCLNMLRKFAKPSKCLLCSVL